MRRRVTPALRTAGVALAALALLPVVIEAIYVAPTAVFMDERSRSAQITVGNSGDSPEEATVELQFGFLDADSAGTPYIRFVDDPGPEFPSAAQWIRAFPQRMRLEPKSQQIVRLLARPPENLPDGEYWTRMIVTGRGAPLRVATGDSAVRAAVNLEIRLVTSVSYRKGRVSTGVVLRGIHVEAEGDSLTVWARMAREGNAAYHGTADVAVVNGRGRVVRQWSAALSVYYPVTRRLAFPLQSLEPGDYTVRFRLRAERPDLPADRVLPAPTVTDSVVVRVM
jgi:hypothetical protein